MKGGHELVPYVPGSHNLDLAGPVLVVYFVNRT